MRSDNQTDRQKQVKRSGKAVVKTERELPCIDVKLENSHYKGQNYGEKTDRYKHLIPSLLYCQPVLLALVGADKVVLPPARVY